MSIDNFTASLIEMAEAVKAKPELEARIEKLEQDRDFFERHLRSEENTSSSLRHTIEVLQAQLSEVRRERDEASFRNLELEELKDKVGGLVGQALAMFRPATPVAEPTSAEPSQSVTSDDQLREEILAGYASTPGTASEEGNQPVTEAPQGGQEAPNFLIQSEAAGLIDPVVVEPQPAPAPSLSPSEPDGWERGKPYSYKPWYMTDSEWVSRGGFGPDLAPPMSDPSPF